MSCSKLPSGACGPIRSLRVSRLADGQDAESNISPNICSGLWLILLRQCRAEWPVLAQSALGGRLYLLSAVAYSGRRFSVATGLGSWWRRGEAVRHWSVSQRDGVGYGYVMGARRSARARVDAPRSDGKLLVPEAFPQLRWAWSALVDDQVEGGVGRQRHAEFIKDGCLSATEPAPVRPQDAGRVRVPGGD